MIFMCQHDYIIIINYLSICNANNLASIDIIA